MKLNKNKDKVEVARQKILHTHFSTEDDSSYLQEFLDMELEVMNLLFINFEVVFPQKYIPPIM